MGSGMDRRAFSSTNCRAGVIIMISRVETFTRAAASASRRPGASALHLHTDSVGRGTCTATPSSRRRVGGVEEVNATIQGADREI